MVDFLTLDQPTLISRKIVVTVKLRNFHTVLCISVFALKLKKLADLPTKSISILISLFHETFFQWEWIFCFSTLCEKREIYYLWYTIHWKILPEIHSFVTIMKSMFFKKVWKWIFVIFTLCTVQYPVCSRNFQNVKLILDFVEIHITATEILREIQFWWIQTVQKCQFLQF